MQLTVLSRVRFGKMTEIKTLLRLIWTGHLIGPMVSSQSC
jgi:hypothetical protein